MGKTIDTIRMNLRMHSLYAGAHQMHVPVYIPTDDDDDDDDDNNDDKQNNERI